MVVLVTDMDILVTGATGFVGRRLVPALVAAGHDVSVLVRDLERYDPPPEVTVFEGDVLKPGSFEAALSEIDIAYYLIHSMEAGAGFQARDKQAAENFAGAAGKAGIERVVYLSGLGVDGDNLSAHLRSRRDVEHTLATGEYALTVLRAAVIIGDGSVSFRIIRQLASRLPVMITPRWINTRSQPIAISDTIAYLVGVIDVPETAGETYEIGGPDVLQYRDILIETSRALSGRKPIIIPVPVLTPRLSAYWVDIVTDVPAEVAYPLIDGMASEVVVTDDRIRELIPIELTSFKTAVRRAIEAMREGK